MGYTTKFSGSVSLSRKLTIAEAKTILEFNDDPDCIPGDHPAGSYMQWVPSQSLDAIGWDGEEKFYDYTKWLQWLCKWLSEIGVETNGEMIWSGEDASDSGVITVRNGAVSTTKGVQTDKTFKPLSMRGLEKMALEHLAGE